eukprot:3542680-Pyramimonas_sp.AAC.1
MRSWSQGSARGVGGPLRVWQSPACCLVVWPLEPAAWRAVGALEKAPFSLERGLVCLDCFTAGPRFSSGFRREIEV